MHAMFDVLQNGISPTEHLHKMIFVDGIMDFQSVKVIGFLQGKGSETVGTFSEFWYYSLDSKHCQTWHTCLRQADDEEMISCRV